MSKADWFWVLVVALVAGVSESVFRGMSTVFLVAIIHILAQIRDKDDTRGTK